MGYSCTRNIPGRTTMQMLDRAADYQVGYQWSNDTYHFEIIEGKQAAGGAWFIIRRTFKETAQTFDLAEFVKVERDGQEFCWKGISEFSGPNETSIPQAMFNRLTPLIQYPDDVRHADDWRARQLASYGLAKLAKITAPKVGEVIVFDTPLSFTAVNAKVTRFRVEEWGRKRRVMALKKDGTSFLARLSKQAWNSPYTIEGRPVVADPSLEIPSSTAMPAPEQFSLF